VVFEVYAMFHGEPTTRADENPAQRVERLTKRRANSCVEDTESKSNSFIRSSVHCLPPKKTIQCVNPKSK
jgi:hypothetical protein